MLHSGFGDATVDRGRCAGTEITRGSDHYTRQLQHSDLKFYLLRDVNARRFVVIMKTNRIPSTSKNNCDFILFDRLLGYMSKNDMERVCRVLHEDHVETHRAEDD